MTEFEEILKEEFLKLSPGMPLNAGEIVAIKSAVFRLLKQQQRSCKARPNCVLPKERCLNCSHNYGVTVNLAELLEALNK